ncbi:MAG: two-component system, OmpR family, response regulator ResD [Clostridia bacterium]|nr:two-component system, OmpR family, response regulator ResD [Clostridia bacterium]
MTNNAPILVVDDEKDVREIVTLYLRKEGFQVETAADGEEALIKVKETRPQLIVLDLMLPKKDGWEVCREIRKELATPIIMLTARSEELDRILGLELGADDYVSKPFSPKELMARIKAVLRRTGGTGNRSKTGEVINYPGLTIDYRSRRVKVESRDIDLAPKEFELLWFLARHPRQLFTREQLLENIWGYDYLGDTRTVDTHIRRLREKLGQPAGRYLVTVWGVGYKFEVAT